MEDARQLVALVRQRELARKEMLAIERQVFLQRSEVKEMKRKLNLKDDDEDLINQKVRIVLVRFCIVLILIGNSLRRSRPKRQLCSDR